jgi:hypothetical protein
VNPKVPSDSSKQDIDDPVLYDRIIRLLCRELACYPGELSRETSLYHDIGADGDDGENIMVSFSDEFQVDMSQFKYDLHFGPEYPFFPPVWLFWRIFTPEKLNKKGQWKMIPITIYDLYQAAKTRVWPIMDYRDKQ